MVILTAILGVLTIAASTYGIYYNITKPRRNEHYTEMYENVYKPLYKLIWNKRKVEEEEYREILNESLNICIIHLHDSPIDLRDYLLERKKRLDKNPNRLEKDYSEYRKTLIYEYNRQRRILNYPKPRFNKMEPHNILLLIGTAFSLCGIIIYLAISYIEEPSAVKEKIATAGIQTLNVFAFILVILAIYFWLLGFISLTRPYCIRLCRFIRSKISRKP